MAAGAVVSGGSLPESSPRSGPWLHARWLHARWLHSAPFDLGLIIGPPLAAGLAAIAAGAAGVGDTPVWAWILLVVGIDVAHVYASLYRVYWDPEEFQRRRSLYTIVPLACFVAGVMFYRHGPTTFWRALAYVAVFHFVRQQYGFLRVYQRLAGPQSKLDDRLDAAALYLSMIYPLAFWHANPRDFAWFIPGDFWRAPQFFSRLAGGLYGAALLAFAARQAWLAARGERISAGKIGVVLSTAAAWYIGIVLLDSDFAFTITNVVAHGIPYFALVWLYGRRRWENAGGWREAVHKPAAWPAFLLPLALLAYFEEGLWDVLVWNQHASVFGGEWTKALRPGDFGAGVPGAGVLGAGDLGALLGIVVPLLALPQATHYVLDAWIWRFDGSNPGLRENLFGSAAGGGKR